MVAVHFANQMGWYAFISLLVLILLYLIRPKPKDTTIPSLMFFIKTSGATKQNSFLRNLINNLLFLLQLLALSALAFALTYPYINVPRESIDQDTVIVLDISASMQARQDGGTRFEKAVSIAGREAGRSTSIVLASSIPIVALEKGSREKALNMLSSIQAKDSTSNIGDAMLMAGTILGNKGRVVVISDMKPTDGLDIEAAKKALTARGLEVELFDVGGEADNVGIINLEVTKRETRAFVRNFGSEAKKISLVLSGDRKVRQERTVLPNSVELFSFETPPGISELRIEQEDALEADNIAYIVGPKTKKIRVLLVTNAEAGSVRTALEASPDIDLKVSVPPVTPSLDYDVVVLNRFSTDLLLPGFFEDLSGKVGKGSDAVITAQPSLEKINFKLMPVKLGKIISNETEIEKEIENEFTAGIEFGAASQYYEAYPQDSTALLSASDGTPLLAIREEKSGAVIYYGIFDESSDFKSSVSYPIFWNKMVNYLYSSQDLGELNTRTEKILPLEEQKVSTPYGVIETSRLFFDEAGIYTISGKEVAANLLNEKESDLSPAPEMSKAEQIFGKKSEEMGEKSFVTALALAGLILVFCELFIAKVRGDL